MRLADKVAIITGGGSGIGRASAVMFAREGAFVAIVDRDAAGAEETLALLPAVEGSGSVHVGDVGDADFAKATIESVAAARGRLDVLMTAAGFSCGGNVVTTDPADWDAVFRANVGGTWLWAKYAVPVMQRQHRGWPPSSQSPAAKATAPISRPRGRSSACPAPWRWISLSMACASMRWRPARSTPRCCAEALRATLIPNQCAKRRGSAMR
jgi:NAD(P)-dependent dehydrogenase (short-subunit alcohol dehydrogenase family)